MSRSVLSLCFHLLLSLFYFHCIYFLNTSYYCMLFISNIGHIWSDLIIFSREIFIYFIINFETNKVYRHIDLLAEVIFILLFISFICIFWIICRYYNYVRCLLLEDSVQTWKNIVYFILNIHDQWLYIVRALIMFEVRKNFFQEEIVSPYSCFCFLCQLTQYIKYSNFVFVRSAVY